MTTIVWITAAGVLIFYLVVINLTNKCYAGGISTNYKALVCAENKLEGNADTVPFTGKYGTGLIPSTWPSGAQALPQPSNANIPSKFDWMGNKYILAGTGSGTIPFNQGQCNSCFIVAPTSTLGDRIAIDLVRKDHDVQKPIVGAPVAPLSCACNISGVSSSSDRLCGGNGGDLLSVGEWIVDNPLPTEACYPLPLQNTSQPPAIACIKKFSKCACSNTSQNEANIKLYTASQYGQSNSGKFTESEIKGLN